MTSTTSPDTARKRELPLGGKGQASFWLEVSANDIASRGEYSVSGQSGGPGGGNWRRCKSSGCLGSAIGADECCFVHTSNADTHLREVLSGQKALDLRGTEIGADVWGDVLSAVLDSSGTISAAILCDGAIFTSKLTLTGLTFQGGMDFTGTIFRNGCEADTCSFQDLHIRYASFVHGNGYFHDCEIERLFADFCNTEYQINFIKCNFSEEVSARGVQKDFRMIDCHLDKSCDLSYAHTEALMLNGTTFNGDLKLDGVLAKVLYCWNMELSTSSSLGLIEVSDLADFSDAHFKRSVRLLVSGTTLRLARSWFEGGGRIECNKTKLDMGSLVADAPLLIIGADDAALQSLENVDCGHLRFSSLDFSDCYFYGCHNLQAITLESSVSLPDAPRPWRARRKCVADEILWRSSNARWRKADWRTNRNTTARHFKNIAPITPAPSTPGEIAAVYRSLRNSVEGQSNQPGAADFYYGEMEMRRRDLTTGRSDRLIVWAYWLVSGYSLRAIRSIFWLLCVFVAGGAIMHEVGLEKSHHSWPTAFISSAQSMIPGLSISANLTRNGEVLQIMLMIIGPVLVGLSALALRNRVKR
jgi:uncharacterized protein YjbI with pentapeptide repeats